MNTSDCLVITSKLIDQVHRENYGIFDRENATSVAFVPDRDAKVLPPRPLQLLPIYHGPLKEGAVARMLFVGGEYLLFLNKDDQLKPYLAIRDMENKCHFRCIEQNAKGHFALRVEDYDMNFGCIDQLVDHYMSYNKTIFVTANGGQVHFLTPVQSKRYERKFLVEEVRHIQKLSYFHQSCAEEDLNNLLRNDGDFVLVPGDENPNSVVINVKWAQSIRRIKIITEAKARTFPLPKICNADPTESISSLDGYLKYLILSGRVVAGVQLKTPVKNETTKTSKSVTKEENNNLDEKKEEEEDARAIMLSNDTYAILGGQPPVPFYQLPYYHGQRSESTVNALISTPETFLLYKNENGTLTLAVSDTYNGGTVWMHKRVGCDEDGHFFVKQCDRHLCVDSVQELINYYLCYNLAVQDGLKAEKTQMPLFCLKGAVENCQSNQNCYVEECDNLENLSYFYKSLDDQEVAKLLTKNGDFLVDVDGNGDERVHVFWHGQVINFTVEQDKKTARYILPRAEQYEPQEFVNSIDHYLKTHVRCAISIGGAVLKRAVQK